MNALILWLVRALYHMGWTHLEAESIFVSLCEVDKFMLIGVDIDITVHLERQAKTA